MSQRPLFIEEGGEGRSGAYRRACEPVEGKSAADWVAIAAVISKGEETSRRRIGRDREG